MIDPKGHWHIVKAKGNHPASISFEKDETIHTENSYKYSIEEFEDLISEFYFLKNVWSDPDNKFAVCYFEAG